MSGVDNESSAISCLELAAANENLHQREFSLRAAEVHAHLAVAEALRDVATAIHETGQSGWSALDAQDQLGEDPDD